MDLTEKQVSTVEKLVKPEYDQLKCWVHGWLHISNVRDASRRLSIAESYNPLPNEIASYCHDLGRIIEEQNGLLNTSSGFQNHALFSIAPSVDILKQVGIRGELFDSIIEAVAIHSYKDYSGKNTIAQILRDADKSDSIGAWGALRAAKFYFRRDFVDTKLIITHHKDKDVVKSLADETLKIIKSNSDLKPKYIKILDFLNEWGENKMFHLNSVYKLFEPEIEYTQKAKEFLLS